jgi:hypothetical protein
MPHAGRDGDGGRRKIQCPLAEGRAVAGVEIVFMDTSEKNF